MQVREYKDTVVGLLLYYIIEKYNWKTRHFVFVFRGIKSEKMMITSLCEEKM